MAKTDETLYKKFSSPTLDYSIYVNRRAALPYARVVSHDALSLELRESLKIELKSELGIIKMVCFDTGEGV